MVLPKLTPELMQASMPRVMRALADHCLRPAKQHFAEWQRHKRNANVAMAQDAEQRQGLTTHRGDTRVSDLPEPLTPADCDLSRVRVWEAVKPQGVS